MDNRKWPTLYCAILVAINLGGLRAVRGEVQLDDTIAPAGAKGKTIELDAGKTYQIDANSRGAFSASGKNVFFSFDKFTVEAANTARFHCGSGCAGTQNVISRMGPDSVSQAEIYGTLKSEIGGANGNFYLLSPKGVIFGQNAKIDVPGTFHATTTGTLKFKDGSAFDPNTKGADISSLDADPQAFGFLNAGKITIGQADGTHKLTVISGKVQMVAGTVEVQGDTTVDATNPGSTLEIKAGAESGNGVTIGSGSKIIGGTGGMTTHASRSDVVVEGAVKSTDGNLAVKGNRVRVDGAGSRVEVGGKGSLSVEATGPDAADAPALTVRNGGRVVADNAGEIDIRASAGSVEVSGGGRILKNGGAENSRIAVRGQTDVIMGKVDTDGALIENTNTAGGGVNVDAGRDVKIVNGTIRGNSIEVSAGNDVMHAGVLDASSSSGGGGSVTVTGDRVAITGSIDASGRTGGGKILIGGDYQGRNPAVRNARQTYVGSNAKIRAGALETGNGGKVVIWSEIATRFYGGISAKGGIFGGDGGLVEVSGKDALAFEGIVDTSAPTGRAGTLLLDPENITVVTGDTGANDAQLNDGRIDFGDVPFDTVISERALETVSAATNIELQANNRITIDDLADNLLNLAQGQGNSVTFRTGAGGFSMNVGDSIRTAGGAINFIVNNGGGATVGGLNAAGGAVGFDVSGVSLVNGAIEGVGTALTKAGGGTLVLNGANTYSGATTVNAGVLKAGAANALSANSAVMLNSNSTLDLDGFDQAIGSLSGGVKATVTNSGDTAAALTAGGDGKSTTYAGVIADGSNALTGLTKVGAGTLLLSGANTYSGATTVNAGMLKAGAISTFSANSAVTLNGASILDLNGFFTQTIGSLAGGAGAKVTNSGSAPGNLAVGADGKSTIYAGTIEDLVPGVPGTTTATVGVNKVGAGTLTLTGKNTYSGSTGLSGGVLNVNSGEALGSAFNRLIFDGGTLRASGAIDSPNTREVTLLANTGGVIDTNGNDVRIAGKIGGKGGLTKTGGGTLTLTGSNDYEGGTRIDAGGTLQVGAGGASGSIAGNVTVDGVLAFSRSDAVLFNGAIDGTGEVTVGGGGTLVLGSANNTYRGATTVDGASTLKGGRANALSPNSAVALTDTSALDLGGFNQTIGSLAGEAGTKVTNGGLAAGTLTAGGDGRSSTYAGTIRDGAGAAVTGLIKTGAGNLTLTGSSDYSGGTRIDAGGALQVGAGAVSGSIAGNVTVDGVLAFNRSDTVVFNGAIQGNGGVTVSGGGTLTLGGVNNVYRGATTVDGASTLKGGRANALSPNSAVALKDTSTLDLGGFNQTIGSLAGDGGAKVTNGASGTVTLTAGGDGRSTNYEGVILDGAGVTGLTKAGAGTMTLSAATGYGGNTNIGGGTLAVSGSGTAGAGGISVGDGTLDIIAGATVAQPVTIAGGTIANSSGKGSVAAGGITLLGNATFSSNGDGLAINAEITDGADSFALTKQGAGTVILSSANTFDGGTVISAGTLIVNNPYALGVAGTGTTVNGGATLSIDNVAMEAGAVTINGQGVGGNGALTARGDVSLDGAVFVATDSGIGGDGRMSLNGMVSGKSLNLVKTGGSITFSGNVALSGLSSAANAFDVRLIGASNRVDGATILANTGALTLGDGAAGEDGFTFSGGLTAISPKLVNLAGVIDTAGRPVRLGPVTLSGYSAIHTANGNIEFKGTVSGSTPKGEILDLAAGTGDIGFGGATVGSAALPLGAVTIDSAANVNVDAGFWVDTLRQLAGSGTTVIDGPINGGNGGISLANRAITLNQAVGTIGGSNGGIALDATAGTLSINADLSADGAGNVIVAAGGPAGDIILDGATVASTAGSLQAWAGRDIRADTRTNVKTEFRTGGTLLLDAQGAIGGRDNRIDTEVTTVAAVSAGGDVFLNQTAAGGALAIGTAVGLDGHADLDGIATLGNNGGIAVTTQAGSLTVTRGVRANGSGDVSLRAGGAAGDIAFDGGTVASGTGHVQAWAGRDILSDSATNAATEFRTGGTLLLDAQGAIGGRANRIDTEVATVAAVSAGGDIFLNETAAGGALAIGSARGLDGHADLDGVATLGNNGGIAVTTQAGSLTTMRNVTANGAGDVALTAIGAASDIIFDGGVTSSGSGTIIATAGDSIAVRAGELNTGGSVNIIGKSSGETVAAGGIVAAGGDIVVSGTLNAGSAKAGRNVDVDGGTLRVANEVAAIGKVVVETGGLLSKLGDGPLAVSGRQVLVDGWLKSDAGDISIGGDPAGGTLAASGSTSAAGNIDVTGSLSAGTIGAGQNLIVAGAAQANAATAVGSVVVSGKLITGIAAAGQNVDVAGPSGRLTAASQVNAAGKVDVSKGGRIESAGDSSLLIAAATVSVDGANSRIEKTGKGDLRVTATSASPAGGYALAVTNGGQIFGGNEGDFVVSANPEDSWLSGRNAISARNAGDFEIRARSLRVTGAGQANPVMTIDNLGEARITANSVTGDKNTGALVRASNQGDLILTPIDALATLTIDPITIEKLNAIGSINFLGTQVRVWNSQIRLDSGGLDGGDILFSGANAQNGQVLLALELINAHIVNKGSGRGIVANNILFDFGLGLPVSPVPFKMAGSVVETRTIPQGQGGNIGTFPLNTKISYGIAVDQTAFPGGAASWQVVPLGELEIDPATLENVYAATHESKFGENIRLSTTQAIQAPMLAVVAQPVRRVDLDAVQTDPCGKEGSSFTTLGLGGFGAEPSVILPLPGMANSRAGAQRAASLTGQDDIVRAATLSAAMSGQSADLECN